MPALTIKAFDEIIGLLEKGKSLNEVLRENEDYPSRQAFYNSIRDDQIRIDKYARATKMRADFLFDQILEISDKEDADVNRNRLQIDSRKWVLSKMNPKKYGEKLDVTSDGEQISFEVNWGKSDKDKD